LPERSGFTSLYRLPRVKNHFLRQLSIDVRDRTVYIKCFPQPLGRILEPVVLAGEFISRGIPQAGEVAGALRRQSLPDLALESVTMACDTVAVYVFTKGLYRRVDHPAERPEGLIRRCIPIKDERKVIPQRAQVIVASEQRRSVRFVERAKVRPIHAAG
jgi:hypothetical protein